MNRGLLVDAIFREHQEVLEKTMADQAIQGKIEQFVDEVIKCYTNGGKILLCGNGGSAADAQHIAAEWQGRFMIDRKPLHAEALHVNTSYLTAVANDFGFEYVYARAVEAQAKPGDILIGLTTSGNSANIIHAMHVAGEIGAFRVGMTGAHSNTELEKCSDLFFDIPSFVTARIQEMHLLIGHIVCQLSEMALYEQKVI